MTDFDMKAELTKGYAALAGGALGEADGSAELVIAGAPNSAEGGRLLARVRLARGDVAGAKAALEAASAKPNDALNAYEDLAELCIRDNDGPRALAAALATRRIAGDLVKYVVLTGRARWLAGQPSAALAEFQYAAPNAPSLVMAQLPLAMTLADLGRYAEAIAVLEALLAQRAHDGAAALLTMCRFDAADPRAALAEVERALARTPGGPELTLQRAALRVLAGDDEVAAAGAALDLDPRQRARWDGFAAHLAAGRERFVGLPLQVLDRALAAATVEGHTAEFGVFGGRTLERIARSSAGPVHGFDSFQGLPTDLTPGTRAGAYTLDGVPPQTAANAELHVGPFADTLPGFAPSAGPARLWHIDCDLYASTKQVFDALGESLVPGSIVVFDDYAGFPGAELHEKRAWDELCAKRNIKARLLCAALLAREAAFVVEEIG